LAAWNEAGGPGGEAARLVAGGDRLLPRASCSARPQSGPSPVDRARPGSKHHVLVDGQGIPLAVSLTGGNRNDVTQLMPDILIDRQTFTISTGQEEFRSDGSATTEAICELKSRHLDVQTTLDLSNIPFGLNPVARSVLNSVCLDECVQAGLGSVGRFCSISRTIRMCP
jgi:hypothetical protein